MVLLAIGDADSLRRLGEEMDRAGHEWVAYRTAAETIDAFRNSCPAVALVDRALDGSDGLDLCELLRKLPGTNVVPLLMRGLEDDPAAAERASRLGVADVLSSHTAPALVVQRIRAALREAELLTQLERSRAVLALSQRMARLGKWELLVATGELVCSAETKSILGLDGPGGPTGNPTVNLLLERLPPEQREGFLSWLSAAKEGRRVAPLEHTLIQPDGTERILRQQAEILTSLWDQGVRVTGVVQDVTERRRAEDRVQFLHDYDSLTGLANRQQFLERIASAIAGVQGGEAHPAVLCLDLNQFKAIAGVLTDRASDYLLVEIARRLRDGVREYDALAHIGCRASDVSIARIRADEFTILFPDLKRVQDAVKGGQRILDVLADPFEVDGKEVFVTVSIGVATFPGDGQSPEEILKRAETAAYCARQQGRNAILFYTPAMNAKAFERLTLETGLRRALERGELAVHYQPRIEITSGRMVGMEALARWRHPELGLVPPSHFIPLAEETGLIIPIGEWILHHACEQNRRWQDEGLAPIRIAVNLSSVQFRQTDLYESVASVLRSTRLDPRWLEMELTESILIQSPEQAVQSLKRLKTLGIHLSIDDFGTGYSSLSYLKRFPIDALKIDQSFIRELTTDDADAAIATSIILMGRSLKLKVVAEGVETHSQLGFLRVMQCDEVQGYLFSPPVPSEEARRFLDGSKPLLSSAA